MEKESLQLRPGSSPRVARFSRSVSAFLLIQCRGMQRPAIASKQSFRFQFRTYPSSPCGPDVVGVFVLGCKHSNRPTNSCPSETVCHSPRARGQERRGVQAHHRPEPGEARKKNRRNSYAGSNTVRRELHHMACCRFRRHRVRCFDGTGGGSWRGGSFHASSSLRRCG